MIESEQYNIEGEIIARYHEKRSIRQWMDVAVNYSDALRFIEAGWPVELVTPGTPILSHFLLGRAPIIEEYTFTVRVSISPFAEGFDEFVRWRLPDLINSNQLVWMELTRQIREDYEPPIQLWTLDVGTRDKKIRVFGKGIQDGRRRAV